MEALKVNFFKQESGTEPVRSWLKSLSPLERRLIGQNIKTVQWGWSLGVPLVRSLGDGLWEIRTVLPGKIARVVFCTGDDRIILLHGFIKKTQKAPKKDIALAKQRMRRL